ncbi:MAG: hypothetical protein IT373_25590 [Polyangiaceae bacterium]|nr:hypothetical protein [Polyangiaceae bacterium]
MSDPKDCLCKYLAGVGSRASASNTPLAPPPSAASVASTASAPAPGGSVAPPVTAQEGGCARGFMAADQMLGCIGLLGLLLVLVFVGGVVTGRHRAQGREGARFSGGVGTPNALTGYLPPGANDYGELE